MRAQRLLDGPIISTDLHPSIGLNIQGPSVIRAPNWIEGRLGDYYLYFADHKGRYIRLAYADNLLGPWKIHPPGSLQLEESCFPTEPPKVTPEQFAQFEARFKQSGVVTDRVRLLQVLGITETEFVSRFTSPAATDWVMRCTARKIPRAAEVEPVRAGKSTAPSRHLRRKRAGVSALCRCWRKRDRDCRNPD